MDVYLETIVDSSDCLNGKTDIKLTNDSGIIEFSLPLIVHLNKGDGVHFINVSMEPDTCGMSDFKITNDDYQSVKITRKDEKDCCLILYAKEMRLLETVKRDYKKY